MVLGGTKISGTSTKRVGLLFIFIYFFHNHNDERVDMEFHVTKYG